MTERIRRFPITEDFEIEFPRETLGLGDTVELFREAPDRFFEARIVRKDGTHRLIHSGMAEQMFRNGMLG